MSKEHPFVYLRKSWTKFEKTDENVHVSLKSGGPKHKVKKKASQRSRDGVTAIRGSLSHSAEVESTQHRKSTPTISPEVVPRSIRFLMTLF